jgi:hypothetical protein
VELLLWLGTHLFLVMLARCNTKMRLLNKICNVVGTKTEGITFLCPRVGNSENLSHGRAVFWGYPYIVCSSEIREKSNEMTYAEFMIFSKQTDHLTKIDGSNWAKGYGVDSTACQTVTI